MLYFYLFLSQNQGANLKEEESSLTATSHIFCLLKESGTSSNNHGYASTALMHIFCVLKCSKTIKDTITLVGIISLQIPFR